MKLDDNKPSDPSRQGPSGRKPKGIPVFVMALAAMLLLLVLVAVFEMGGTSEELDASQLRAKLEKNEIKSLEVRQPEGGNVVYIKGKYESVAEGEPEQFSAKIDSHQWEAWLTKHEESISTGDPKKSLLSDVEIKNEEVNDNLGWFLKNIIPILIIVAVIWFFFFRRGGGPLGGGVMAFGKSKAKMFTKEDVTVTFNDVAGADEAKEEVSEIVEFLKTPQKFTRLGAKIPKGVLMIGPPGCGKTLLAKAIAGEAERPFFSISGSDFVEMFVGVGASRVRDLFRVARENAPCIVFVDEIDAVGRRRGTGMGGGNDEREQTLNALLVEMDGIGSSEGVIILAATNRPDVLDNALLRPGRFDRQVYVDLPDLRGREEILSVHLKKVKAGHTIDAGEVARLIPGFSGADIMNLVNEAALIAVIRNLDEITRDCILEARDRVAFGRQKRSRVMEDEERKLTAYHEAGHALVQELTPKTDRVHKVTIIPRGRALGATMSLPEKDRYSMPKSRAEEMLQVMLGGRAAEHVIFGEIDAGAASDIQQATNITRKMVTEWGMSPRLGLLNYAADEEQSYMGQPVKTPSDYSDETKKAIDEEMRRIIDEAWAGSVKLIEDNREKLIEIAEALLKYETLDHEDLVSLLTGTDFEARRAKVAEEIKRESAAAKHRRMEETSKERQVGDAPGYTGSQEQPGTA